jgi:hypothetical protein
MKNTSKIVVIVLVFLLTIQVGYSQYSSAKVKDKFEAYTDSLKNVTYDHTFPIFGQKVYQKGFDIPYPAGLMANYVWMKQDILITNLQLGFEGDNQDIPLTPVDFIDFGKNTNVSNMVNFRPDLWVFPFLNVYGLLGKGTSTTDVNIVAPINLTSVVEQDITTVGFGVMGAAGVGPVFLSVDANWTWSKPKLLDEAVLVNVVGIRFGHSFVFKHKPQSNIAVWVGTMYAKLSSETTGAITLNEAIPNFSETKDQIVSDYNSWYDGLPDGRIKDKATEVLNPIIENIDNANGDGIVSYGMNKQVKQNWNGLVGAQYQYNKHWQLRTEAGIVGNRESFLVSLNYRFLM